ncbi:hypothetical protein V3C99_000960 [Haemonchus contortus]
MFVWILLSLLAITVSEETSESPTIANNDLSTRTEQHEVVNQFSSGKNNLKRRSPSEMHSGCADKPICEIFVRQGFCSMKLPERVKRHNCPVSCNLC